MPRRSIDNLPLNKLIAACRRPTSWSYSKYRSHEECATKYALENVVRMCSSCGGTSGRDYKTRQCRDCGDTPPAVHAIDRGIEIHSKGEQYLKGNIRGVPDEFKKFSRELMALKRSEAKAEASWAISRDGEVVRWDDWNRAWLRVKVDAHFAERREEHVVIVDFKSGREKSRSDLTPQCEINVMLVPFLYSNVKEVHFEYWFTDHGSVVDFDYKRKDLPRLLTRWQERADKMLSDKVYAPNPSLKKCSKCPYRSSRQFTNGRPGPCDAWKKAT